MQNSINTKLCKCVLPLEFAILEMQSKLVIKRIIYELTKFMRPTGKWNSKKLIWLNLL